MKHILTILILSTLAAQAELVVLTRRDLDATLTADARTIDFSGPRKHWSDDAKEYERAGYPMPADFPAVVDTDRQIVAVKPATLAEATNKIEQIAATRDVDLVAATSNLTAAVAAVGGKDTDDAFQKVKQRIDAAQTVAQLRAATADLARLMSASMSATEKKTKQSQRNK